MGGGCSNVRRRGHREACWKTADFIPCRLLRQAMQRIDSNNCSEMFGNGQTALICPIPVINKSAVPLGEYNGKFMSNQMVLRGGSCATPRSHIRPTYRNFFPV